MKPPESPAAVDWSRAKSLHDDLKTSVRRSLAAKVLLGKELETIQKRLGFTHGDEQRFPKVANATLGESGPTWDDWCKAELGFARHTAWRYVECFRAVLSHAKGQPDMLRLLQTPSEKLDSDELAALAARASQLVCDKTESSLLAELKALKEQAPKRKKSKSDQAAEAQKLNQTAAELIFGGIDANYKKLKCDLNAAFSETLGRAVIGNLDVVSSEPGALSLVGIRDHFRDVVNDVENNLKILVRKLDDEIEKRVPTAAKRLKTPPKTKR